MWAHRQPLIAFDSNRRGGRKGADWDIYVMDPRDPASVRLITEMEGVWTADEWSPDDSEILVSQSRAQGEQHLWRVDVSTGKKKPLTDPAEVAIWRFAQYSPDGRFVYALSNRGSEFLRLWRCELRPARGPRHRRERRAGEFCPVADGRTFALVYDSMAGSRVELRSATTLSRRVAPPHAQGSARRCPAVENGGQLGGVLHVLVSALFGDVLLGRSPKRGRPALDVQRRGHVRSELSPCRRDGAVEKFRRLTLSGVLTDPPPRFTGPVRLMISIHGGPRGPTARERPRYQGRSGLLPERLGGAILYPNVRGSYGYARRSRSGRRDAARDTGKDVGALLDWIAAEPSLDENASWSRGSYGGHDVRGRTGIWRPAACAFAASGISDFICISGTRTAAASRIVAPSTATERSGDPGFLTRISPVSQAVEAPDPAPHRPCQKDSRVPVDQADSDGGRCSRERVCGVVTLHGRRHPPADHTREQ